MAYTRIHAIKSTVTKAVAYICNPDKTEEQLLVDTFGCGVETARHPYPVAASSSTYRVCLVFSLARSLFIV